MQIVDPESGVVRAAPMEGGPRVKVLVGAEGAESGKVAAARVVVPPGGGMPEHDHGESEALVAVQSERVVIETGGQKEELGAGFLAVMGVGERVSLRNPSSSESTTLLAIFSPPGFAKQIASWPAAE